MRKLYVCSKSLPYKNGKPNRHRLIGVLTELRAADGFNKPGQYRFEYKITKFHEWFMKLKWFPVLNIVYEFDSSAEFLKRFLPAADFKWFERMLNSVGLAEYDEWGCLIAFGDDNPHGDGYLFETLPENTIVYENID